MNPQAIISEATIYGMSLPDQATTRSGVVFNPREDSWNFREELTNVSLRFDDWGLIDSELKSSFKMTLVWQFKALSPKHSVNMFARTKHLFLYLIAKFHELPVEISEEHLISYAADPNVLKKGYLSSLTGFLKHWHRLGYPGVSKSAIDFLKSVRLKGNEKGVAVRTMDPVSGPLTVMETEALLDGLTVAFRDGRVNTANYLLAWLTIALGMRPVQYAALKVCDLKVVLTPGGDETFLLSIPRAKQRGMPNVRTIKKERSILPEVGRLLQLHIQEVKQSLYMHLPDVQHAPLFPSKSTKHQSAGLELHRGSTDLAILIRKILESLNVHSYRTGAAMHLPATRLRRTVGTRAAEEGHGPLVIAELLDHTDTQNVGVYVEATPEIISRLDRAIAMQMAPLAQAFAGKIIKGESDATRASDPRSRIIDLRIDRSGEAMGSCGQFSHCGFSAPIACYRCTYFEPWLDGPHEAVLEYLLDRREKLQKTADARIASVNDLTILAVAEVVRRCGEAKVTKLGEVDV